MERGLYAAASGMIAQQRLQETLAQNVANAGTVGYKQDALTFRAFPNMLVQRLEGGQHGTKVGELGRGVGTDQTFTDWENGSLSETHNPLDASLGNGQFFVVRTPRGDRYTRAGNFRLDGAGNLLTASGNPVVGRDNRPVNIGRTSGIRLDGAGNLTGADGKIVASLSVVQADVARLRKDGDTLFATLDPTAPQPARTPNVRPGTLEQSNQNPVRGLVQLIDVSRGFEMAQRALKTQDELLRKAATEVGKV